MDNIRFSDRVILVSERGKEVCQVHRDKAQRLLASKQAVVAPAHLKRKMITQLTIPERKAGPVTGNASNSLKGVYLETLDGGEVIRIETREELPRFVTTERCQVFKMKRIRKDLLSIYRAPLIEAIAPFKPEYLKTNPIPESVDPVGSAAFSEWPKAVESNAAKR